MIFFFLPEITLAVAGCVGGGIYAVNTGQLDVFPIYAIIYCLVLAVIATLRFLWVNLLSYG